MTIPVSLKKIGCNEFIYVLDEIPREALQQLTKKKTLSFDDLDSLGLLGVTFSGL